MKTKLKAKFVRECAENYLKDRQERINRQYEEDIEKQMKPSFFNFYKGRTREKAIIYLDNNKSGGLGFHKTYLDHLNWRGSRWSDHVEEALIMARLSESHGDGTMWVTDDDMFFLEEE